MGATLTITAQEAEEVGAAHVMLLIGCRVRLVRTLYGIDGAVIRWLGH